MNFKKTAKIIFFAVILMKTAVYPEDTMRIAVMDLTADGVSQRTGRAVSDMLRTELINSGTLTLVERTQVETIIREQGFQQTGCTDQECAVQVGRLVSARKILIGSVSALGASIVINVRIVDVERGVAEFAAREKAETEAKLDAAVVDIGKRLVARIAKSRKKDTPGEVSPEFGVTASVLFPFGNPGRIFSYGFGGLAYFSLDNMFRRPISLGAETGYWHLIGRNENIDRAMIVPFLLFAEYDFKLYDMLYLAPKISAGGSMHNVVYHKSQGFGIYEEKTSEKTDFMPVACAGISIGYEFSSGLTAEIGAEYCTMFDKASVLMLASATIGAGFRF